jgi:iron complex outermembrane receptor protein
MIRKSLLIAVLGATALSSTLVYAQTKGDVLVAAADQVAAADTRSKSKEPEEVIVTGTRFSGLKAVDSSAPIQLVSASSLTRTGQVDLRLGLADLIPSFNAQAFGGDTANLTLSARLRGVSPNDTLVLINGKRRHTTANLAVLGGAYQGSAATDLNFIPISAVDRIEVLQDGAAAQYGTDAIAGVINVILKDASEGGSLTATGGQYFQGDGTTGDASGTFGFKPTSNSILDLTFEARYHGFSDRGLDDQRLINPLNPSYAGVKPGWSSIPGFPHLNLINGDAQYRLYNSFYNFKSDINNSVEFYSFGSYGRKDASAYENYRLPNKVVGKSTTDIPFPNGFKPRERIIENDYAVTGGFKFKVVGWDGDLSTSYGLDHDEVRTENSSNASLYLDTSTLTTPGFSPTSFLDGYFISSQLTNNLDLRREFNVGLSFPINVAFGVEQRTDTYEIAAGDAASRYKAGAQSYPGFSLSDAGSHSRDNYSFYLDLAAAPVKKLRLDGAVRYEHFSNFGDTTVGKVNARYDFTDDYAVRGTVSTGFRAPTLAEEFYSATNVSPSSAIVQLPPNAAAAQLIGIQKLTPEKSTNLSFGVVAHPTQRLTATLDVYQIEITDRIFGSGTIFGLLGGKVQSAAVTNAIIANGNSLDPGVSTTGISVFLNGIDTRTRGADLVVTLPSEFGNYGNIDWSFTGNYNTTKVTKVKAPPAALLAPSAAFPNGQPLFGADTKSFLETASPKYKLGIGAVYNWDRLAITFRETLYGPSTAYISPGDGNYFKTTVKATPITDLEVSYKVFSNVTVALGANNLFDKAPDKLSAAYQTDCNVNGNGGCTSQYPTFSPFGINGGYYYGRATVAF